MPVATRLVRSRRRGYPAQAVEPKHHRRASTGGARPRPRTRSVLRSAALAGFVAITVLTCVAGCAPVAADPVAALRAQETQNSEKLVQDQLQVDAYQQQYSVSSATLAADASAIDRLGRQIWQDEQQISERAGVVRQQAVRSYMDAGSEVSSPEVAIFVGDEVSIQVADEYSTIAVGNIGSALARLGTSRRALQSDEAALQAQRSLDRSDQEQRADDLAVAQSTEAQLATLQDHVTAQLAAALAVSATVANVDPPLNAFLQCVVRAESSGDYGAVSPNGRFMGAFQFSQSTWNMAAESAGRTDLVGTPPNLVTKADQDAMAVTLFAMDGQQPWFDPCRS